MVKRSVKWTLVIRAIAAIPLSASIHLAPMSCGFPAIFQNGSLCCYQISTASKSDLQSANIAFLKAGSTSV